MTLDKQLKPTSNCVVLERPYHLSYPFIFEYQEQIYMIPETETNRAVELYRCTRFPDRWEFVKTLLTNIRAVDATLPEANGNLEPCGWFDDGRCLYSTEEGISLAFTCYHG